MYLLAVPSFTHPTAGTVLCLERKSHHRLPAYMRITMAEKMFFTYTLYVVTACTQFLGGQTFVQNAAGHVYISVTCFAFDWTAQKNCRQRTVAATSDKIAHTCSML